MAKIKLAPFMQTLSGRMGGVVYKSTRFGTEMAEFEAPTNPNTSAQQAVRSSFTKATQQWRNLTTAQAAAWRAYASTRYISEEITNQRYHPTGFNAFVALAAKWFAVNPGQTTAPANPPTTSFAGDVITVTAAPTAANTLTFTASAGNATNVTTALLIQRVSNANAEAIEGNYKNAQYFRFTSLALTRNVTVTPGYWAVGYQFVNTATGQTSSPVFLGIIGPVGFTMVTGGTSTPKKTGTSSWKTVTGKKKPAVKKTTTKIVAKKSVGTKKKAA